MLHNGKWVTRDEWMTARGYVRHGGKYVTLQERDLLLKSEGERAAETAWYPKIRQWYNWMTARNPQRAAEGRRELPAADRSGCRAGPRQFSGRAPRLDVRLFCVQLLGQMSGPKPVEPLVRKSLFDDEHAVRIAAQSAIRQEQHSLALEHYVPELKSDSNKVVQRAAVAIRDMGDLTAVPYLIAALVTQHRWKVEVPQGPSVSFSSGHGELAAGGGRRTRAGPASCRTARSSFRRRRSRAQRGRSRSRETSRTPTFSPH